MAGTEFAAERPSRIAMTVLPMPPARSRPDPEPAGDLPGPPLPEPTDEERLRKRKDKIRSAWISFAGRIVAQIVGAAATVTLTLAVVHKVQTTPPSASAGVTASDADASSSGAAAAAASAGPALLAGASTDLPRSSSVLPAPTVAVLPLEDFSGHGAQRGFAEAMTEALVAELTQHPGLQVISRTSSMQYRDAHLSLPAIARALGATYVIEGSVVRDGTQVRITAQLVEGATDRHLWARTYDRDASRLLRVHAEIAGLIARDVSAVVAPGGPAPVRDASAPIVRADH
jgi:TolB-like protein